MSQTRRRDTTARAPRPPDGADSADPSADAFDPSTMFTGNWRRRVELLDLGSGVGKSVRDASRRFGLDAVGIDMDRKKVRTARRSGIRVVHGDILDVDPAAYPAVRYVNIDNVLEHLSGPDDVERAVRAACSLAASAVYIRHPSFEDEDYLAGRGVKAYWTDWPRAHTAKVRVAELIAMANRAGVYRTLVTPVYRIRDSSDPAILPVDAPPDQHSAPGTLMRAYVRETHGPKPQVEFDRPVYYAFDVVLVTGFEFPELTYRDDPETSPERPDIR